LRSINFLQAYPINPDEKPKVSTNIAVPIASVDVAYGYSGPSKGKIIKKIGPYRAAPPIPDDIAHKATNIPISQYYKIR